MMGHREKGWGEAQSSQENGVHGGGFPGPLSEGGEQGRWDLREPLFRHLECKEGVSATSHRSRLHALCRRNLPRLGFKIRSRQMFKLPAWTRASAT